MLQLSVEDVIEKIKAETGLSEEEIREQIKAKLKSLEGLVSEEGAAYIVASELNVSLFKEFSSGALKIKNVLAGMNNVELVGKVVTIRPPITFSKDGKKGEVASFIIGDETGKIRVVLWDKRIELIKNGELKEGDVVKIKNAYAKESIYGGCEIHLNNRSKLILNPEGIDINLADSAYANKKISELSVFDKAKLLATVVKIFRPKFYFSCPECGKKVEESEEGFVCATHKIVEPKLEMVLNIIVDDSSETIRAVAFGNIAERLAGVSAKDAQEIITKDGEMRLRELLEDALLGKTIEIYGRLIENKAFERTEFQINEVVLNPNPKIIAANLLRGE